MGEKIIEVDFKTRKLRRKSKVVGGIAGSFRGITEQLEEHTPEKPRMGQKRGRPFWKKKN